MGKAQQALKYHQDALKIDREIGYRQGEADDLGNIANIYYLRDKFDKAIKYTQLAIDIFKKCGYVDKLKIVEDNLSLFKTRKSQS